MLEESFAIGKPDTFNTDQGAQYTTHEFIRILLDAGIKISMDGRGRAIDNVWIERLWRTVKYEDIYIRDYVDGRALFLGLSNYFAFYNTKRPHSSLDYKTPSAVYFDMKNMRSF